MASLVESQTELFLLSYHHLHPQAVLRYIEDEIGNLIEKGKREEAEKMREVLYGSKAGLVATLKEGYPRYINGVYFGSAEKIDDTKRIFDGHEVEFSDENKAIFVAGLLNQILNQPEEVFAVLKFSDK